MKATIDGFESNDSEYRQNNNRKLNNIQLPRNIDRALIHHNYIVNCWPPRVMKMRANNLERLIAHYAESFEDPRLWSPGEIAGLLYLTGLTEEYPSPVEVKMALEMMEAPYIEVDGLRFFYLRDALLDEDRQRELQKELNALAPKERIKRSGVGE